MTRLCLDGLDLLALVAFDQPGSHTLDLSKWPGATHVRVKVMGADSPGAAGADGYALIEVYGRLESGDADGR